jgi:hypothetical protein
MVSIAKLGRPSAEGVIPRERLFARLDELSSRAAVWVCGPPGAGKTSLVASWLSARAIGGLWYQIDAGDEDIAGFFHDLGRAATGAGVEADLPAFAPEQRADLAGFARRWFRALWARAPRPFSLVLDNYQEAAPQADLHVVVREALAERPADAVAVVVSRSDPPAELARLRANRQLLALDWDELRLSGEEGEALAAVLRPGPSRDAGALVARCDGWAAGLVLLLDLASWQAPDAIGPRSRQALFDYFMTELFDRLPARMRELLLCVCAPPWIDAPMARALTGHDEAGELLEELRRRRLFTDLRGETRYQFHALFREFLQVRARIEQAPERQARIAGDSARLLAEAGDHGAAVDGFLAAGLDGPAADLIRERAEELHRQGRHQTLESWIRRLPGDLVAGSAWLTYWLATCRRSADFAEGRRLLEQAFEAFERERDVIGQIRAAIAILDTYYLSFMVGRHLGPHDAWADALARLLRDSGKGLDRGLELEACDTLLTFGMVRPRNLDEWVTRTLALMQAETDVNRRIRAARGVILYLEVHGRTREIASLIAEVLPLLDDPLLDRKFLVNWLTCEARCRLHFLGPQADAFATLDRAIDIVETHELKTDAPLVRINYASCYLSIGEPDGAEAEMALSGAFGAVADAAHSSVALLRGRNEEALALARRAHAQSSTVDNWLPHMVVTSHRAFAEAAAGELDAALAIAHEVRTLAHNEDAYHVRGGGLVEAYARLRLGETERAAGVLTAALGVWSRNGYLTTHPWIPAVMAPLLAFALERGIQRDYVERLIRCRRLAPPSLDTEDWPWPVRIRALGRFEVSVDGAPLPRSRKAPKRLLLVLKTLVALGADGVPEDRLADLLWPDHDGDVARSLLFNSLFRLRRLLGLPEAIEVQDGRVTLNPELVWIDTRSFEHWADRGLAGDMAATGQALALWRGPLLADEPDLAGAHGPRERLRGRFLRLAERSDTREMGGAPRARAFEAEPEA